MAICSRCGAPCGYRNPVSIWGHEYYCDKCYKEDQSEKWKCILGFLFLGVSAVLSTIVSCTLLKGIAKGLGGTATRITTMGLGVGCIVLYYVLRKVADQIPGCLVRIICKVTGFLSYALGVGLLFMTIFLGDKFKECVGCTDKENTPVVSEEVQVN